MVIARSSSALFDIDLDDVRNLITRELPSLNTTGMKNIGRDILREFLHFVVAKVRSQGRQINDVVIIIDEIVSAEEELEDVNRNVKE